MSVSERVFSGHGTYASLTLRVALATNHPPEAAFDMKKPQYILGMRLNDLDKTSALNRTIEWTKDNLGRYVCVANVHMCMECFDSPNYKEVVNGADMVVADGRPLVWAMKLLGNDQLSQIRGSDLMVELFCAAEKKGIGIGLYGSSEECISGLAEYIKSVFPKLDIGLRISPPFRPVSEKEKTRYIDQINASGVDILFVGLGCPKQEKWMAEVLPRVSCVMIGVGAAFDFYGGRKKQAPVWMQRSGLEWAFRLACEPRRLWLRYLKQNPRFVWYFIKQLLGYDFNASHWT